MSRELNTFKQASQVVSRLARRPLSPIVANRGVRCPLPIHKRAQAREREACVSDNQSCLEMLVAEEGLEPPTHGL
jgi:hypothetical protein